MQNPYLIEGPAVISFSGGRTSGYMLRKILDAGLQRDVVVMFANTGAERALDFVHEIEMRWNVPIVWVEYDWREGIETAWRTVDYATASRRCEPFEALITKQGCLPNPAQRWCTQELKIRPMGKAMRARAFDHWEMVIGIRADEPRRVAQQHEQNSTRKERWTSVMPLAEAGATLADVMAFWKAQAFDLQLKSYEGNCSLCFLKHVNKRERIAKDRPQDLAWWIEQEARTGQFFRLNEPEYKMLPMLGNLFDADLDVDDEIGGVSCHCTD